MLMCFEQFYAVQNWLAWVLFVWLSQLVCCQLTELILVFLFGEFSNCTPPHSNFTRIFFIEISFALPPPPHRSWQDTTRLPQVLNSADLQTLLPQLKRQLSWQKITWGEGGANDQIMEWGSSFKVCFHVLEYFFSLVVFDYSVHD